MKRIKYFSMFSGIGGFELGIQRAFMQPKDERLQVETDSGSIDSELLQRTTSCVGYSEIDKYAIKVYERQFNGHKNYGDATAINPTDLPDFDLLVGGFPCQAFSIAGKRKGFDDTRGTLFFDIARIAREKQPMYMLLENVKGLISHDGGKTLEVILETLQDMGYYVNYEVHNSKDYGVPQNRERIYFSCRHAKLLKELGQTKTPTISKQIISEYLFQLLLNNLKEVKKLQETNSKEWVLSYLLLKEISQSLKSSEENISDGITTLMDGSIFLLKEEELWQNIDTWLSKNLADGSNELNMFTISTAIKRITTLTTYTFSAMQRLIWLAIVALKKSQPNLWQEVLSDLTLIQEGTKYARINNKKEEVIVTESGTAHFTTNFQNYDQQFIVGHLGNECGGKVFPIARDSSKNLKQLVGGSQGNRVYSTDGVSSTLASQAGGLGAKTGLYAIANTLDANYYKGTNTLDKSRRSLVAPAQWRRTEKGKKARREAQAQGRDLTPFSDGHRELVPKDSDVIGTITSQAIAKDSLLFESSRIRRLTPLECERLQGFPDNWTALGIGEEPISDTQRYKMCGNAVTVNTVQAVMERLFNEKN
jgi:DNA-cytosine methyltransferase